MKNFNTGAFVGLLDNFGLTSAKVSEIANKSISESFEEVRRKVNNRAIFAFLSKREPEPKCRIFQVVNGTFLFVEEWNLSEKFIPAQAKNVIKMASMFIDGLNRESLIKGAQESINNALDYQSLLFCKDEVSMKYGISVIDTRSGIELIQSKFAETRPIEIVPIPDAPRLSLRLLIDSGLSQATGELPAG